MTDGPGDRSTARVGRWDRPPAPHDWRYVVDWIGRAMVTAGLLIFGFVAYQLWGTGIETARAQDRLEDRFSEVVARATAEDPGDEPNVSTVESTTATTPSSTSVATDVDTTVGDSVDVGTTDGPVDDAVPDLDRRPAIVAGEAFARLQIPRIDQDLYVVPGVDLDDLKQGPGHFPETPLPGQLGNSAIAGHRTTYGSPFFDVDQLEPGDELIVTMLDGSRFVYEVTGTRIVAATDYYVVETTDPTVANLTLTSCHPKYTAQQRIVVSSVLVPERSDPVGPPEQYDLGEGSSEPIGGDDPTFVRDEPDAGDATVPVNSTSGTEPDAIEDDAIEDDAIEDDAIEDDSIEDDVIEDEAIEDRRDDPADGVFNQGWFHDAAAWPQIALWAGALIAIWMLSYRLARRVRHLGVGIAVGIVPFVVALYFFYQNVNRLLPPGF